jgi:hypothetical protein
MAMAATTDRDGRPELVKQRVHSPHSAQCSDGKTPPEGPNAHMRARARESNPESAQPQPDCAPDLEDDEDEAPLTLGDYFGDHLDWLRNAAETFTPPDIWSKDRPSLSQVWAYAARGEWTGPDGAPRRAGQLYALGVALPAAVVAYALAWVFERPARLIAAAVLVAVLTQIPPLSWLI